MDEDNGTENKDTFQEPRKRFWLRSRKRPKSDAISIGSMDISIESEVGKKKKRRRITEVASSIFSSGNKHGNTLHRSFTIPANSTELSFAENETDTGTLRKKRKDSIENTNSFTLKSWILDVAKTNNKDRLSSTLSRKEVKRQEAIYELYCGENVLLNDLQILRDFYYEPLMPTGIFTSDQLETLFSGIAQLLEIHSRLRDELINLRDQYGFTETVGPTILNWIPMLNKPYLERCRTQIWAKHLLDEKRLTNKRLQSFIKKRLESTHSVDLWTYIDVARSRIVKYPILVKEILRHTPLTHSDQASLKSAYNMLSVLLTSIDTTMGDAECKLAQSKITVKSEYDPAKCVESATELITEGQLKDSRGMKYQCFLFDTGFAMTRRTRSLNKKYNLSCPVVPKEELRISTEEKSLASPAFKVCDRYLTTEDEHGKRHWVDSFNKLQQKRIAVSKEILDTNEKENQPNVATAKQTNSTRSSAGDVSDSQFSLSVKDSLIKQKRSSIGYI